MKTPKTCCGCTDTVSDTCKGECICHHAVTPKSVEEVVEELRQTFLDVSVMGRDVHFSEVEAASVLFSRKLTSLLTTRDQAAKEECERRVREERERIVERIKRGHFATVGDDEHWNNDNVRGYKEAITDIVQALTPPEATNNNNQHEPRD